MWPDRRRLRSSEVPCITSAGLKTTEHEIYRLERDLFGVMNRVPILSNYRVSKDRTI